jgi:hypothetical protein
MKKIAFTLLLLSLYAGVSAQYKKASFFEKTGRTYGLGARLYALGDGKGSPIGFYAAFGRDQDGKSFFTSWEIQYIPSYKFSLNTLDANELPVTIIGKSKAQFIYAYNFGWHLLKNEGSEKKFQPYLTTGFNMVLFGGIKEINNDNYDNKRQVSSETFSIGIGGGGGCFYNITPGFALKLEGGYTLQGNIDRGNRTEAYYMFTKHPYVSAGVRFRVITE